MRKPRILVDDNIKPEQDFHLAGKPLQHLVKVLRLRAGDEVILFDGNGGEWDATLVDVQRDHARAKLVAFNDVDREPPVQWELVQGISRGERMDYTLQKCVELGVSVVHPVMMKRTVVKLDAERAAKRHDHWQGVVDSAAEQSGRTLRTQVNSIVSLDEFLSQQVDATMLLLDPAAKQAIGDITIENPQRVLLFCGPEGGFDDVERDMIARAGAVGVRMGPRVLRTETAAVVAAALLLARWGDL